MNSLFLFYGCPCSGKDFFINQLLKRQQEIFLFIYFFVNIVGDNSCTNISCTNNSCTNNSCTNNSCINNSCTNTSLKEKVFFIQLIKYFHKLTEERYKFIFKINGNSTVSFQTLIDLTRHFMFLLKPNDMKKQKRKQKHSDKEKHYETPNNFMSLLLNQQNSFNTFHKRKNKRRIIKKKTKNKITKITRINKIIKIKKYRLLSKRVSPFFIFYKYKLEWQRYFKMFQKKNQMLVYNISTDFIEEQFYRNNKIIFMKKKNKNRIYYLNKRYIIIEQKRNEAFYIYFHKSNIKNEKYILKNQRNRRNRRKKKKIITSINQSQNWKKARKIAYLVCKYVMKNCYSNRKNNKHRCYHKIILLNDTFHFPSMRKKYFILTKKYWFNYVQTFLEVPLKTCLQRNQIRKKFKYISDETIVKNFLYHNKYAIRSKQIKKQNKKEETDKWKSVQVILSKNNYKWQSKILSLHINNFQKKQFIDILFFLYKYSYYFKNVEDKKKADIEEERRQKEKMNKNINPLDILNVTINRIIHEKLSHVPNEQKEKFAKQFRLIKLELLKNYRKKPFSIEHVGKYFVIK